MISSFDAVDGLEYQIEVAPVGEQDFTTYLGTSRRSVPN